FGAKLRHGVYQLYAREDKDGYPDPNSTFYRAQDFNPTRVQLFGERPESSVTLDLGDKAGLVIGRIFDGDTGRPLKAGVILINLDADARLDQVVDGKFRQLVPADTDVNIAVEIVGPDHDAWSRFDTKLNLQPGEERDVDFRLYRKSATE